MQAEGTPRETNLYPVDDNDQVLVKTLMNPVILDKVFSFLNTTTLNSVRLVCPTWDDIGATLLGKQGRLVYSIPWTNSMELTTFHPKLAKNVVLCMTCYCYAHERCACSPDQRRVNRDLPPNFAMVLPEICDQLETLCFSVQRTFRPHLYEMWSTYDFPNLVAIRINLGNLNLGNRDDLTPVEVAQFRPLPNLKDLLLEIHPNGDNEEYFSGVALFPVCQGLLNSAPHLEKFRLMANFYPDLTPCRKLKEVEFTYAKFQDVVTKERVEIDLHKVMGMLENCQNSLESLTLGYVPNTKDVIVREKLNFNFPNLTHLEICAPNVYKIEDSLDIAHLPKLTHFSVLSSNPGVFIHMFENYHRRHTGITSLHVEHRRYKQHEGQDRPGLVSLFPAVKELTLKLKIDDVKEVSSLRETMERFGGWELTRGEVEIEHDGKYADSPNIIAVLEGLKEWRGLANTTLLFSLCLWKARVELTDGMRDALLACRTIKSVTIDWFRGNARFQDFVREYNLPIFLLNARLD